MYSLTTPIAGQPAGEDMVILDSFHSFHIHLNKVTFTYHESGSLSTLMFTMRKFDQQVEPSPGLYH